MRRQVRIGALLLILLGFGRAPAGEHEGCPPPEPNFLQRLHPVGGWHPYGGGLLHWWDPHCFPRCGAADDYHRKSLPQVCWPPYPPYYQWGPPAAGCPQGHGSP